MSNQGDRQELVGLVQELDPGFWRGLNKTERERLSKILPSLVRVTVSNHSSFSGPIPPAQMLEEYGRIIPNGADRIMKMAEDQSGHRQRLETAAIASQNRQSERGQIFAFILAIVLIAVGLFAFLTDHDGVAMTIFGSTIVGLVTVFAIGRKTQRVDLDRKAEPLRNQ